MTHDPKDPFETMQREVERLWRDLVYHRHPAAHFADQAWSPPADVVVADTSARVILELAGVPRETVRVRLRGNLLDVSGRRIPPVEPTGHHYHRAEIYFGEFRRVVELPWQADPARVTALYHDGMLEIRLHAAAVSPRTEIEVQGESR